MKNYSVIYIILALVVLTSCNDDFLEPKIDRTYGDEFTWDLPSKAKGVLMNAYANIPGQFDSYDGNFLDCATDNAVTNNYGSFIYKLSQNGYVLYGGTIGDWALAYNQFRNIHLFMKNALGEDQVIYDISDTYLDSLERNRLRGEAYFLRAWWGMYLLQHFGGIDDDGNPLGYVILTEDLNEENKERISSLPRNTFQECVDQIISDCDSAILFLPYAYWVPDNHPLIGKDNIGRADQRAAWALKSRVVTYSASPAYQSPGIVSIPDNNPEDYTISNNTAYNAKWDDAAQVSYNAILAINNGIFDYYSGLNATNMVGTALNNEMSRNKDQDEIIFRKYHNNRSLEVRNFPPLFFGNGRTNPSQNLVDAFPDSDGFPISLSVTYDPQNPYAGRDPRLDLFVYHHGQTFGINGRSLAMDIDNDRGYKGMDAPGYDYKNTRTGYYLKKWMSNKNDMLNPILLANDVHMHMLMRKTEIYLNLAEAMNEAYGPTGDPNGWGVTARDIIEDIRTEAGITNSTYLDDIATQGEDAFRTLIQNERRIELAFENHRFFDMRRWLLPLDEPIYGVELTREADSTITYNYSDASTDSKLIEVEQRPFNHIRYYYSPLPYEELIKFPNIKNNKGWN